MATHRLARIKAACRILLPCSLVLVRPEPTWRHSARQQLFLSKGLSIEIRFAVYYYSPRRINCLTLEHLQTSKESYFCALQCSSHQAYSHKIK